MVLKGILILLINLTFLFAWGESRARSAEVYEIDVELFRGRSCPVESKVPPAVIKNLRHTIRETGNRHPKYGAKDCWSKLPDCSGEGRAIYWRAKVRCIQGGPGEDSLMLRANNDKFVPDITRGLYGFKPVKRPNEKEIEDYELYSQTLMGSPQGFKRTQKGPIKIQFFQNRERVSASN